MHLLYKTDVNHVVFMVAPQSEASVHAPTVSQILSIKCSLNTVECLSTGRPISANPFQVSHLAKLSFGLFLSLLLHY